MASGRFEAAGTRESPAPPELRRRGDGSQPACGRRCQGTTVTFNRANLAASGALGTVRVMVSKPLGLSSRTVTPAVEPAVVVPTLKTPGQVASMVPTSITAVVLTDFFDRFGNSRRDRTFHCRVVQIDAHFCVPWTVEGLAHEKGPPLASPEKRRARRSEPLMFGF